ncbi:MAG: ankyrin repeat domain-containing protein, partial [Spirochaetaceae bacterium]|nr:ankyrin repeat domain-containing protein [Spirochaetaceae bacterium]
MRKLVLISGLICLLITGCMTFNDGPSPSLIGPEAYKKDFYNAYSKAEINRMETILKNYPNKIPVLSYLLMVLDEKPKKSLNIIELLIKYGANLNEPYQFEYYSVTNSEQVRIYPLFIAINKNNSSNIIEYLLLNGANVNSINDGVLNVTGKDLSTPLIEAVAQQNISIVKLLIENGADVNIRLENQRTNFLKTVVGDTALS